MNRPGLIAIAATLLTLWVPAKAHAEDRLKIGLVGTFSGPPAAGGLQMRNGFQLALKALGGKLGGRDVEVIAVDDELKPDLAVTRVKTLLTRDKVDFVVGPIFSSILVAIFQPVTSSNAILISPNAGASNFAGAGCNPNFFVTSYQTDQIHEVLGSYAKTSGLGRVILMAPNYQAGRDGVAGFKRTYGAQVLDEIYVPLNQLDYSAELAKIAAEKPDALSVMLPGGMGVNFVKQFHQAGLAEKMTFLSAFTVDEITLPAQQDAAIGMIGASDWAPDLDMPQNRAFVAAYLKEYGDIPATYAFQAYDTALLIDSAVRSVKGDLTDKDALRAALKRAQFQSLRGRFSFNNNHYPIQDFYLVKAAKRLDGKFQTEIFQKAFDAYGDSYAKDCPMK